MTHGASGAKREAALLLTALVRNLILMKNYLSKTELARRMNVHHSTIVRAVQAGRIKTVPHLGREVIPLGEVRRLLEPLGSTLEDVK